MDGDEATGVSIIRLVEELDAGPVCLVEETPIGPDDDFQSLSDRLQAIGARLLAGALADQSQGHLFFEDQSAEGISYAERITAEDRLIDPSRPAKELERLVRALRPHIGARLLLPSGEGLGVRRAMVRESGLSQGQLGGEERELILGCAEGSLVITRVIPAGGREMDAADWLRGGPALT
jgi:methionyl-tRNA formyltransferase